MKLPAFFLAALVAAPAFAQSTVQGDGGVIRLNNSRDITRQTRTQVALAPVAILRGLDKLTGESSDIQLNAGEAIRFGPLIVEMGECRYPRNNPNGDAFVLLNIQVEGAASALFEGWMVASSPALNALEHPRYDIWAIRCKLDSRTPSVVAGESSPRPIMRP